MRVTYLANAHGANDDSKEDHDNISASDAALTQDAVGDLHAAVCGTSRVCLRSVPGALAGDAEVRFYTDTGVRHAVQHFSAGISNELGTKPKRDAICQKHV